MLCLDGGLCHSDRSDSNAEKCSNCLYKRKKKKLNTQSTSTNTAGYFRSNKGKKKKKEKKNPPTETTMCLVHTNKRDKMAAEHKVRALYK